MPQETSAIELLNRAHAIVTALHLDHFPDGPNLSDAAIMNLLATAEEQIGEALELLNIAGVDA